MRTKICLILSLINIMAASFGQTLKYDILRNGGKIGEMTITQKDSAGLKVYIVKSQTEVNVSMFHKTSDLIIQDVFDKGGQLISTYYHNVRDDGTIITNALLSNGKYLIEKDGEKSSLAGPINFSGALLYFAEPKNAKQAFSERLGKLFDMKKQSEGVYQATLDSGTGLFTYKNNQLERMEVNKAIVGTIVMQLVH